MVRGRPVVLVYILYHKWFMGQAVVFSFPGGGVKSGVCLGEGLRVRAQPRDVLWAIWRWGFFRCDSDGISFLEFKTERGFVVVDEPVGDLEIVFLRGKAN
jgi:hypothetical protein